MAANKLIQFLRDHKGGIGRAIVYVAAAIVDPNDTVIQNIRTAFNSLSKAVVTGDTVTKTNTISTVVATMTGAHSSIKDRLRWTFRDTANQYHHVETPAPKDAAFLAGSFPDIDPAWLGAGQPGKAFVDAIVAGALSQEGEALTFVDVAYRRSEGVAA